MEPEEKQEDLEVNLDEFIVLVKWSCGLAIGQPYWQIGGFECNECTGEGAIALPFSDLNFDPPVDNSDLEMLSEEDLTGLSTHVYCTECRQQLEEYSHFDATEAVEEYKRCVERRSNLKKEK